jgi:hypothetical protein
MNTPHELGPEDASRLAVTATVADLEYWARRVAVRGKVDLRELVGVLEDLRAASNPQQRPARPAFGVN